MLDILYKHISSFPVVPQEKKGNQDLQVRWDPKENMGKEYIYIYIIIPFTVLICTDAQRFGEKNIKEC